MSGTRPEVNGPKIQITIYKSQEFNCFVAYIFASLNPFSNNLGTHYIYQEYSRQDQILFRIIKLPTSKTFPPKKLNQIHRLRFLISNSQKNTRKVSMTITNHSNHNSLFFYNKYTRHQNQVISINKMR